MHRCLWHTSVHWTRLHILPGQQCSSCLCLTAGQRWRTPIYLCLPLGALRGNTRSMQNKEVESWWVGNPAKTGSCLEPGFSIDIKGIWHQWRISSPNNELDVRWEKSWIKINKWRGKKVHTRDNMLNLRSVWAFVTVMNYRVRYSGQVTHVASPPAPFRSAIEDGDTCKWR